MAGLILRRLGVALVALLGVSLVMFLLLNVLPGDPVAGLLPPSAGAEDRERLREHMGLNDPLPLRYLNWVLNLAQGDLGFSHIQRAPIAGLVTEAAANTIVLAAAALTVAGLVGVSLGVIAGLRRGSLIDRVCQVVTVGGMSMPNFWLALLMVMLFAAQLRWLPASGMTGPEGGPLDLLRHMVLPVIALAVIPTGILARSARASIIEISQEDFVELLRAKGLGRGTIVRHLLRNAAPPVLTLGGLQIGFLLGGSVLIESIFAWPGLGYLMHQSISNRDMLLAQSCVLVVAVIFVLINLIVDVVQIPLNPRLRTVGR